MDRHKPKQWAPALECSVLLLFRDKMERDHFIRSLDAANDRGIDGPTLEVSTYPVERP